jgi:hypothetical protein
MVESLRQLEAELICPLEVPTENVGERPRPDFRLLSFHIPLSAEACGEVPSKPEPASRISPGRGWISNALGLAPPPTVELVSRGRAMLPRGVERTCWH